MNTQKYHLHDGKKGAALAVRVTPRSSRNEIAEVRDDGTVRVRLKAALVDGQANEALVTFLSDVLNIQPTKIEIVAGATGRDKLISILDLDSETVHERIIQYLGKS